LILFKKNRNPQKPLPAWQEIFTAEALPIPSKPLFVNRPIAPKAQGSPPVPGGELSA
jgi:hypothetical protein